MIHFVSVLGTASVACVGHGPEAHALSIGKDQDVGMEMLMLEAEVSGDSTIGAKTRTGMGVLSLAIMDTTQKRVEAKSDADIQAV